MPDRLSAALLGALTVLLLVAGCSSGKPSVTAASLCAATPDAGNVNIASSDIVEASGLASSRLDDNILWVHNDSGDTARVFAIDRQGRHQASYTLPGAEAIDWEDMAAGPGPDGASYLYLADIGDNNAQRADVTVYRVPEPQVSTSDTPTLNQVAAVEKLTLRYPDHAHDAETLLVDPLDGDLVIVTKELATGTSLVFHASPSFDAAAAVTLEQAGEIDFKALPSTVQVPQDAPALVRGLPYLPTAGDVSPDGRLVAIRTYGTIWVWSRDKGMPLWTAFTGQPCEAPSQIEQQGEAIAFDPDGRGYTTTSEGTNPPLHHFTSSP